jgi:uncharacterized membrane protein HdeD (DUF308 family)
MVLAVRLLSKTRVGFYRKEAAMTDVLARNWGWVALRGVVAILFGLLTIVRPGITLSALILLFGAFAIADGSFRLFSAFANRRDQPRWGALALGGLLGIVAGVIALVMPGVTGLVLLYVIAVWTIVSGAAEIAVAIELRKVITGEWALVVAGVLSILFGAFLVARPTAGAIAVAFWIGIYAVALGSMLLVLAFRLRHWEHAHHSQPSSA